MELLNKTRVINQLLQKNEGVRIDFTKLLHTLRDIVVANVFLVDAEGEVTGHALAETYEFVQIPKGDDGNPQLGPDDLVRLMRDDRTHVNIQESTPFCHEGRETGTISRYVTVIPIQGGGDRIGTLMLTRHGSPFHEEDIVLAEYSSTVFGLEMMRTRASRQLKEGRDRSMVQMAISSLSYSELEAVDHIFAELSGREGLLVASRIADRAGITRSVIVNALRKLESAGVVEARSLGMKGTHIKILNEKLLPMLEDIKSR